MNIPNSITLGRLVLVPLVVWLIIDHQMEAAFLLFLLAGLSDAADGYLAKRYGWNSELGAYLDPIADKALLVSIYVTLGFAGHLPVWLVIAVVSRDILIVGAVVLSWMLSRPLSMRPLLVSKANTLSQIVLAGLVLAELGLGLGLHASGERADLGDRRADHHFRRGLFLGVAEAHGELRAGAQTVAASPAPGSRSRTTATLADRGFVTVTQLTLDLPHRAALGAEDFLVSDCNLAAVRLVDAWPNWQNHVQLLLGPEASGKTHLARVWQALSGAQALAPETLVMSVLDGLDEATPLVVEDADRIAYDEKALFHLLNLAREKRSLRSDHGGERAEPVGTRAARPQVAAERGPGRRDRRARRGAHPYGAAQAFRRPPTRYRSEGADLSRAACGPLAGRRRRRRGGGRPRGAGLGPKDQPPTRHRGARGVRPA